MSAEAFNQPFSNEEELLDAYEQDSDREVRCQWFVYLFVCLNI